MSLPAIHGRTLRALACLGTLLVAACGSRTNDSSQPGRPPIVLISIDTLRADHLPVYGYEQIPTPAIEQLRAHSLLFENAYSQTPLTLPSHATLLTGLRPSGHGVLDNFGYRLTSDPALLLPEQLRRLGYATGGAVSSVVLGAQSGLGFGFDVFEDDLSDPTGKSAARPERPGAETIASILPWLESVAGNPFFLFVHLYEPHLPWNPPQPWRERFGATYDGEIAAADAVVGKLLDELRRLQLYDGAVIILTSDHGEGLGEHGEKDHGVFVYRESLQVPLLLKLPGSRLAGTSVSTPVELTDVAPTILALLGQTPEHGMEGEDLLELARSQKKNRTVYGESYIPRLHFGWSELRTLIGAQYQYIDSPDPELFDLEADPAGLHNLFAEKPEIARELRAEIVRIDSGFRPPSESGEEIREQLAALGYIGVAQSTFGGDLPAPASQTHLLAGVKNAYWHSAEGRLEEAVTGYEKALAENPKMSFAWYQLAKTLARMERFEAAFEAHQRVLELTDYAPHLVLPAARIQARLGQLAEAQELARRAQDWDPAAAHALIANLALGMGDLEEAEVEARVALAHDGDALGPQLTLIRVKRRMGALDEALLLTETALETTSGEPVQHLHYLRGDVLAELGRLGEATLEMRREIELYPQEIKAYSYLAALLEREGLGSEGIDVLRELVATVPSPRAFVISIQTLFYLHHDEEAIALLAQGLERFPDSLELRQLAGG